MDSYTLLKNTCKYCGEEFDWSDPPDCEQNPVSDCCELLVTDRDFEWNICTRCEGHGWLGGWPGAYTESDRAEWSAEDYDDYRNARRGCEDCGGTGKVYELTEEAEARPEVQGVLRDYWACEHESYMERLMGA